MRSTSSAGKSNKPYKGGPKKKPQKPSAKRPAAQGGKKPAGTGAKVEIFTASFCPHCADAKFYFKQKKIPFKEYNLEHSADAEKRFRGYGGKAIPLIIVKGKVLRRWDIKAFEAAYNAK